MISIAAALLLAPTPLLAGPPPQRGGRTPAAAAPAGQGGSGSEVPAIQDAGDFYVLQFTENAEEAMSLAEFVKACHDRGALVYYLTGRHIHGMEQGTIAALVDKGFPIFGGRAMLQLKPDV